MKRYDLEWKGPSYHQIQKMVACETGDWVDYADHATAIRECVEAMEMVLGADWAPFIERTPSEVMQKLREVVAKHKEGKRDA